MKKVTLLLSLFFAIAMTALAQSYTLTVTGLDLAEEPETPQVTTNIGNNSWIYSITQNLPGTEVTHTIDNVSVTHYRAETDLLTCDDSINSIRYTVFETTYNQKYGNYPFFVLAELIILDENGDTINYTPTSNADHNSGGGSTDGAGLPALNDGNLGNYFHTSWLGSVPTDYHHIEFSLEEPIKAFKLIWYTRPNQHINPPTKVGITPGGIAYTKQHGEHEYSRTTKVNDIDELSVPNKYFTLYAEAPENFEYNNELTSGYGNTYIDIDSFNVNCDSVPSSIKTIQLIPDKNNGSFVIYQPFKHTFYAVCDSLLDNSNGYKGLQSTTNIINKSAIINLKERNDGDFEMSYKLNRDGSETDVWIGYDMRGNMKIFSKEEKELLENAATTNDYSATTFKYPVDFGFTLYNVSIKEDSIIPYHIDSLTVEIGAIIDTLNNKIEKYNHDDYDLENTKNELLESISNIETAITENNLATIFTAEKILLEKGYNYMAVRSKMYRERIASYDTLVYVEPPYTNEDMGKYPISSKSLLNEISTLCLNIENRNYTIYNIDEIYTAIESLFDNFETSVLKSSAIPCIMNEKDGLPGTPTSNYPDNLVWKSPEILLNDTIQGIRITFLENNQGFDNPHVIRNGFPLIALAEFKLYDESGNEIVLTEENFRASSTEESGEGFDCGVARLCDGAITGAGSYYHSSYTGNLPTELVWIEVTFPEAMKSFSFEMYGRDRNTHGEYLFWLTPQSIYLSNLNEPFESDENTLHPAIETITLSPTATWNNLDTELKITGTFTNNYNKAGRLYYSLNGASPISISGLLNIGDSINTTISTNFTNSREKHSLQIYSLDEEGNKLSANIYKFHDVRAFTVNGLQTMEYTGNPIVFDSLVITTTDSTAIVEQTHYNKQYVNNINAGSANIHIEGIFPYSIGSVNHYYTISRAVLNGEITITDSVFVYNGTTHEPAYTYTDNRFDSLTINREYYTWYSNNTDAGTGKIIVQGKGNYQGRIEKTFTIEKATLTLSQISLNYNEDITYDGNTHTTQIINNGYGIGDATIIYTDSIGNNTTTAPSNIGEYKISVEFTEGYNYLANRFDNIASFCIYEFDEEEWNTLTEIYASYDNGSEWNYKWDINSGKVNVSRLYGLTIKKGHITEINLSNNNISGEFPYSILTLSQLKKLNLSNNNINGNIGNGFSDYINTNSNKQTNIEILNIENNKLEGNIGEFVSYMPSLKTLDISNNCISDIYPVISQQVNSLNISNQNINKVIEINIDSSIDNIISDIPTILLYNHSEQNYRNNISLILETDDWNAIAEYTNENITLSPIEKNIYKGESGDTINATVQGGDAYNSLIKIKFSFASGDVDFNTLVNILDMQSVINFSFTQCSPTLFNYTAGNVYADSRINVQDVVSLINILLSQDIAEATKSIKSRSFSKEENITNANVYIKENKLIIYTSVPIASADITISNANEIVWKLPYGFTSTTRDIKDFKRCILYSLAGSTIPIGETVIAELEGNTPVISNLTLSDINAQEIKAQISTNNTTTGISSTNENSIAAYFKNSSLYVNSNKELHKTEWYIYDATGCLIASGNREKLTPRNTKLSENLPLKEDNIYIIRIISDNTVIKSKLINNK